MATNTDTTQRIIPAYPYIQYRDDDNINAFFEAYNQIAQGYLDWFNNTQLGDYRQLTGPLLDWIAEGLYGIARPALPGGAARLIGPLNTWTLNTGNLPLNTELMLGSVQNYIVTDDIFKRIITWHFFKGDGSQFTTTWLKKRVMRFLTGVDGATIAIDQTYPISVTFVSTSQVDITVTLTTTNGLTLYAAQILQAAVGAGVLQTPFQLTFAVLIVNNLAPTNLTNVSNVLHITTATGWPTSATGLAAGKVWANGGNGGVVTVVPGVTPDPFASPLIFGTETSADLLMIGGGNLPTADPHVAGQLWNNSNVVNVSAG